MLLLFPGLDARYGVRSIRRTPDNALSTIIVSIHIGTLEDWKILFVEYCKVPLLNVCPDEDWLGLVGNDDLPAYLSTQARIRLTEDVRSYTP